MPSPALQVELDLFRGPLHTLLDLIERRELPVTRVSLVEVADQFLAVVRDAPSLDLDLTAEFLYVATRLLLLKSQALLPQTPSDETREAGDDEDDLEERLLTYRRFRDAARLLAERQEAGLRSSGHPASSAPVPPLPPRPARWCRSTRSWTSCSHTCGRARAPAFAPWPPRPPTSSRRSPCSWPC